MTQAQATCFNNIIDLTEDDDDSDRLGALSEAASKAEAAANRVTSQLQSMTSASTVGQKDTPHRRIPSEDKAVTLAANGVRTKPGEDTAPGTRLPMPDNGIQSPITGPRIGSLGSRGPIHNEVRSTSTRSDRPQTPETSNDRTATDASAVRSPRAAAQYAGRDMANTYDILNPLEAQREASVLSPKIPGRPMLDQWRPEWNPKKSQSALNQGIENREKPDLSNKGNMGSAKSRMFVGPTNAGSNGLVSNIARPTPAPLVKRKRSSASPPLNISAKLARRDTSQSRYSSCIPESLEVGKSYTPSSGPPDTVQTAQHVRDTVGSVGKRDFGALTPRLDNHSSVLVSRQKLMLFSVENGPLFEIFKTIIYPALKRAKKRIKQSLSEDELLSISKSVGIHWPIVLNPELIVVNR